MADIAYYERQSDGSLRGYDSDGNVVMTTAGGSYDPHASGAPVYEVHTDPQTGETYRSREYDHNASFAGMEYGDGDRKTERKRQEAERASRVDHYGRGANDAIGAIDDPWQELEGHTPSYEDLMGDEYTSTLGDAEADPMAVAAQRAALQRMGQVARTGYTAEDRAVEQQARSSAAQFERQQRDAIMQQAAMRGMQGAGTTLSAQLQAQQAGANRNSQASLDMAANAQRRALQALAMQNSAAGQMRGQSFSEDATRRGAVDEANRYMIDGQRSAARDQFGMRGQVAQGQSQAANAQATQNRAMMENAQGQKTDSEKTQENIQGWIGAGAEFF